MNTERNTTGGTPLRPLLVVKLGGAANVPHDAALDDIAGRVREGARLVIVHGGSAEADRLGKDVGHPPRTLTSPSGHTSRHTDPRTRELFVMATALVNRTLVGALQRRGIHAAGISGLDGALLAGERKTALRTVHEGRVRVVRDDWSGKITRCNPGILRALLDTGHTPVVAPLAMTTDGDPLNVDGDRAAAAIAAAVSADHATSLVMLTGARGLYRAFPDERTRIAAASIDNFDSLLGFAQGRMKRKVVAAREALEGGAQEVAIGSARGIAPITSAMNGGGTILTPHHSPTEVAQ